MKNKERNNVVDSIILLNLDGSVEMCNVKDLDDVTHKDTSKVKYILMDVGLFTSEYILIPRKEFIRKFKYALFEFNHCLMAYDTENGLGGTETVNVPNRIECHNVLEFYRTVHGFMKLQGYEQLIYRTYESYPVVSENEIKDFRITVTIGKKTRCVDVPLMTDAEESRSLSYILSVIFYAVHGNNKEVSMITPNQTNQIITNAYYEVAAGTKTYSVLEPIINTETMRWFDDNMKNSKKTKLKSSEYMIGCYSNTFDAFLFNTPAQLAVLRKLRSYTVTVVTYYEFDKDPIPMGYILNSKTIDDLDGEYLEIYTQRDISLYGLEDLITVLANLKYIFFAENMLAEASLGVGFLKVMLDVRYTIKGQELKDKDGFAEMYHFTKHAQDFEEHDSFFNEFVNHVRNRVRSNIEI